MRPDFPPHIPGLTPRPPAGAFDHLRAGLTPMMTEAALRNHSALRGGLELLAAGYNWEAHEVLESVWLAAAPGSRERHLAQCLVQFANARLKVRMGRTQAAARIIALSQRCLDEAGLGGDRFVLGIGLSALRECLLHYNAENDRESAILYENMAKLIDKLHYTAQSALHGEQTR